MPISKKPGNIFIDSEDNIRLGDFGLATKRQEKPQVKVTENEYAEANEIYEAIEDFSALLGESSALPQSIVSHSSAGESMTGGVGEFKVHSLFCLWRSFVSLIINF